MVDTTSRSIVRIIRIATTPPAIPCIDTILGRFVVADSLRLWPELGTSRAKSGSKMNSSTHAQVMSYTAVSPLPRRSVQNQVPSVIRTCFLALKFGDHSKYLCGPLKCVKCMYARAIIQVQNGIETCETNSKIFPAAAPPLQPRDAVRRLFLPIERFSGHWTCLIFCCILLNHFPL